MPETNADIKAFRASEFAELCRSSDMAAEDFCLLEVSVDDFAKWESGEERTPRIVRAYMGLRAAIRKLL